MIQSAKIIKSDSKDACIAHSNHGFILTELLVTIMISVVLLNVLMRLYLASERSVNLQNALSQIQNDANDAILILTSEIKKSGHIGCARLSHDFPIQAYHEYTLTPVNKLVVKEHELIIRYADYPNVVLVKTINNTKTLYVSSHVKFSAGDILFISNCQHAEIFQAAQVKIKLNIQEIIAALPLHYTYEKDAEISHFQVNKYYIEKTNRAYRDGTIIRALFVENINHRKYELVANVDSMKINDTDQVGIAIDLQMLSPPLKKPWHAYVAL